MNVGLCKICHFAVSIVHFSIWVKGIVSSTHSTQKTANLSIP